MMSLRLIGAVSSVLGLGACEVAAVGAVAYYVQDGVRWEVHDQRVGSDLYRITVQQGELTGTGAGEAEILFRRRAEDIVAAQGCAGYTVLAYRQGLENDVIGIPQRISEGLIRCQAAPASSLHK